MQYLHELMAVSRVDRVTFLIDAVRGQRVLHVGCVDSGLLQERLLKGDFLHGRLRGSARELWGLDIDEDGIAKLQALGYSNVVAGSAEDPPVGVPRGYFDIVVAGELIEHVRNAGRFLDAARESLRPGGVLIVTTPNALRCFNWLPALTGRELVHPDHLVWYSPYTLRRAVERAGFEALAMHVYATPPQVDTCKGKKWGGRWLRRFYNGVMGVLHPATVGIWPYLSDGLILVATRPPGETTLHAC